MINIPKHFFNIPYKGANYPDPNKDQEISEGANCQLFAYKLLEHHGLQPPYYRSSELWEDTEHTEKVTVTNLQELDILLWNSTSQAWGAHVGVYIGNKQVIHLCKAEGYPVIWDVEDFKNHSQYAFLIGIKRILKKI